MKQKFFVENYKLWKLSIQNKSELNKVLLKTQYEIELFRTPQMCTYV